MKYTKKVHLVRRIKETYERVEYVEQDLPIEVERIEGYDDPMEMCLCGRCASAFYNLPDHKIMRVDPEQYYKDTCDYCGVRTGYDYLIYEKITGGSKE